MSQIVTTKKKKLLKLVSKAYNLPYVLVVEAALKGIDSLDDIVKYVEEKKNEQSNR